MLFKQMKYFVAIVENNSFTEAAATLFISQSAISQQIQSLEEEIGVQLLKRENRKFSLTPAGDYLYRQSKAILAEVNDIQQETMRIGQDNELQLRIGYLTGYRGMELIHTVSEYAKKYPEVYMHIQEGTHEQLYEQLREDKVDLLLNDQRRAFSEEYQNVQIAQLPTYVEISSNNDISKQEHVKIEQLRRIPCILVAEKEQQMQEREFYQNTLGFSGNFLFADSIETAKMMVIAGRGFLLSEESKKEECRYPGVVKVPLFQSSHQLTRNYCVFWKKSNTNYYIEEFADLLEEQFAKGNERYSF